MALALVALWFWFDEQPLPSEGKAPRGGAKYRSPDGRETSQDAGESIPGGAQKRGKATLRSVEYAPNPEARAKAAELVPYKFVGSGKSGRIVDKSGRVLMASDSEVTLIGFAASPDNSRLLARGGDAVNYVFTPSSGVKITLPFKPPGDNLFPLADWYWVDNQSLLGISGVQLLDQNGEPIKTDNNMAQTKLYLFRVGTQSLEEIPLPNEIQQPVVTIPESSPDGHFHLYSSDTSGTEQRDLGWFKIDAPRHIQK